MASLAVKGLMGKVNNLQQSFDNYLCNHIETDLVLVQVSLHILIL